MLQHVPEPRSFLRLNHIPRYVYTMLCYPFIHQGTLGWLPLFGSREQCFYEHGCTGISLRPSFQFSWAHEKVLSYNIDTNLPPCSFQPLRLVIFSGTTEK